MRLTRWSSRWSRGQFQFRLREFLLLVALIAVVAAWWNDHRKLSAALAWQKEIGRAWSVEQATGPPKHPRPGRQTHRLGLGHARRAARVATA